MNGIRVDGRLYEARLGFMLLSLAQRTAFQHRVRREAVLARSTDLLEDRRADAVAAECCVRDLPPDAAFREIRSRASFQWPGVLDAQRMDIRLVYEAMHDGPGPRDVAGFRQPDLERIDRELAAGSSVVESACAVLIAQGLRRRPPFDSVDARFWRGRPMLHLLQKALPTGVELSRTASPSRPYEPTIVQGSYAYPVSRAWFALPSSDLRAFAAAVADWLSRNWPEALALCDDPQGRPFDVSLDRQSVVLVAEAYARGYLIEESALFVVEQRSREETGLASEIDAERIAYMRGLAERFRGSGATVPA